MGVMGKIAKWFGVEGDPGKIMIIGLDNSGKSSFINHVRPSGDQDVVVAPTVGFSQLHAEFENIDVDIIVYDMSGQGRYRNLWEHYYSCVDGVIFVIDASDEFRLVVVKEELEIMFQSSKFIKAKIPLLVVANKIDKIPRLTCSQISDKLDLSNMIEKDMLWTITEANSLTGEGVKTSLNWLIQHVNVSLLKKKEDSIY